MINLKHAALCLSALIGLSGLAQAQEACVAFDLGLRRSGLDEAQKTKLNAWYRQEIKALTRVKVQTVEEAQPRLKAEGIMVGSKSLNQRTADMMLKGTAINCHITAYVMDDKAGGFKIGVLLDDTKPGTSWVSFQKREAKLAADKLEGALKALIADLNDPKKDGPLTP